MINFICCEKVRLSLGYLVATTVCCCCDYVLTSVIVAGRHLIGTQLHMTCLTYSQSQVHHVMTTMDTVMSFRSAERYGKFRVKIVNGNYEYNLKSFRYL
jgi:hypothetical protein